MDSHNEKRKKSIVAVSVRQIAGGFLIKDLKRSALTRQLGRLSNWHL